MNEDYNLKKNMMQKAVLIAILLSISCASFSCTSFILRDNNGLFLGKNLDYYTGRGFVFINQRNDKKTGACIPPEKPTQWVSKYGSITFNIYGKDLPMSGMNEKGLVIEDLWLDVTEYPEPDERKAVPELGWIQYMLDNCSTIDEVIEADKHVRVANTSIAKIHFILLDSTGKSAIIEILNGKTVITKGDSFPIEVIENQTYSQSLEFMKNNPLGAKSYLQPIIDKRERFEMIAQMIMDKSANEKPLDFCFNVLKKVTWTSENMDAPTQWSIVYDITGRKISFKTKDNTNIRTISLNDFSFHCSDTIVTTNIQTNITNLMPENFHSYTIAEAKLHLRSVYDEVPFTKGKIPDQMLDEILMVTNKNTCTDL